MVRYLNNLRFFSATSNKHPTFCLKPTHKVQLQCRFKTKVEEPGVGCSELEPELELNCCVLKNWTQNWVYSSNQNWN